MDALAPSLKAMSDRNDVLWDPFVVRALPSDAPAGCQHVRECSRDVSVGLQRVEPNGPGVREVPPRTMANRKDLATVLSRAERPFADVRTVPSANVKQNFPTIDPFRAASVYWAVPPDAWCDGR
jgi:hypothetical protein